MLILKVVSREAYGTLFGLEKDALTYNPAGVTKSRGSNLEEVSGIQAHYLTELIYKTVAVLSIRNLRW